MIENAKTIDAKAVEHVDDNLSKEEIQRQI